MPQRAMVRIWVASLHQQIQCRDTLDFCFTQNLKFRLQGWIRTASTRRIVRRGEKAPAGLFQMRGLRGARAHQQIQCRDTLDFCFTQNLKFRLQGWIRTASTRRIVRRGEKAPAGLFQMRGLRGTRAHQTRKIRTCFRLEKGSDFSFSSGTITTAPVEDTKLRYLVIDRKPITSFGGYDYEVRCKNLFV